MSAFEEQSRPELEPENQAFIDLMEQVEISVDDAFDETLKQIVPGGDDERSKSVIELIQFDTSSLEGEKLFSILKTESGGKPDQGAEKIRLLARQSRDFASVREAVESTLDANAAVPYRSDSFFIAHQTRDGEWSYARVDNDGIYPWVPALKDMLGNGTVSLEGVDVMSAIAAVLDPEERAKADRQRSQIRQLDKAYALELIAKLDEWPVIPQN